MVGRALLIAMLALTACAGPRLETAGGPSETSVTLTDAGIQLTILPGAWDGYPRDLGQYYTPIELRIRNDRNDEIQVRFTDFLAVDDARNQYRVVSPSEVVRALFGAHGPLEGPYGRVARCMRARPSLLARPGPWWPYPNWPYRHWHPFYGPYYPDPFYSDSPYWLARPTGYDILTLALREGRVLPGARVRGFLYFQQATRQGSFLTLTWTPVSAEGKPLATLSSQFRIIR